MGLLFLESGGEVMENILETTFVTSPGQLTIMDPAFDFRKSNIFYDFPKDIFLIILLFLINLPLYKIVSLAREAFGLGSRSILRPGINDWRTKKKLGNIFII